jgi:hypothetical protein
MGLVLRTRLMMAGDSVRCKLVMREIRKRYTAQTIASAWIEVENIEAVTKLLVRPAKRAAFAPTP